MVLDYLGIARSQDELARLMGVVIPIGVPSSRIKKLQTLGLTVIYQDGTIDDIRHWLEQDRPVVVFLLMSELPHWRGEELQHAVVVIGMDEQTVYLLDPALESGPTPTPIGDFWLAWDEMDNRYAVLIQKR
jgi:ABC-type bacteriocin/lantibiotic exporter with double-glycine peptidase domain